MPSIKSSKFNFYDPMFFETSPSKYMPRAALAILLPTVTDKVLPDLLPDLLPLVGGGSNNECCCAGGALYRLLPRPSARHGVLHCNVLYDSLY